MCLVVKEAKTETSSSQDPLHIKFPICTKSVVHKSSFFRHKKPTTTRKKNFVCLECNKAFYTMSNLNDHVKIHKKPKIQI